MTDPSSGWHLPRVQASDTVSEECGRCVVAPVGVAVRGRGDVGLTVCGSLAFRGRWVGVQGEQLGVGIPWAAPRHSREADARMAGRHGHRSQ